MLVTEHRKLLKDLAYSTIESGLTTGSLPAVDITLFPEPLTVPRATFVTLEKKGKLRGCIGSLEAYRPLVEDVIHNSFAAAFSDPRFPPVTLAELQQLDIQISILNPAEEINCQTEQALYNQLRPGKEGLIIEEGPHRATFLPSVWESLPQPEYFVKQLKLKAGLPENYWSDSIRCYRYTTECF